MYHGIGNMIGYHTCPSPLPFPLPSPTAPLPPDIRPGGLPSPALTSNGGHRNFKRSIVIKDGFRPPSWRFQALNSIFSANRQPLIAKLYLKLDINGFHWYVKYQTYMLTLSIFIFKYLVMATIFPHFWRVVHMRLADGQYDRTGMLSYSCFILPPVVGMPLPQTVKDVEDWTRNQKRKKSQLEEEKGKELKGFDNVVVNVQNCSTNMWLFC